MGSREGKYHLTLQGLASTGRQWDEDIPFSLLADVTFGDMDADSPLFSDMKWKGQLESGDGQFMLTGNWQMTVPRRCGRCCREFAHTMQANVDTSFVLGNPDEADVFTERQTADSCEQEVIAPPGELNMLEVLREQFWLAWQPMVICAEDCKGLCLQCGVDLNTQQCECKGNDEGNPFAALKNLKFDA